MNKSVSRFVIIVIISVIVVIAVIISYNKVTVQGAAASRVFFHLKAEAVRMGEQIA